MNVQLCEVRKHREIKWHQRMTKENNNCEVTGNNAINRDWNELTLSQPSAWLLQYVQRSSWRKTVSHCPLEWSKLIIVIFSVTWHLQRTAELNSNRCRADEGSQFCTLFQVGYWREGGGGGTSKEIKKSPFCCLMYTHIQYIHSSFPTWFLYYCIICHTLWF